MKDFYYRIDENGEIYIYCKDKKNKKNYLDWIDYCNTLDFSYCNKSEVFLKEHNFIFIFKELNELFEVEIYQNNEYRILIFRNLKKNMKIKEGIFLNFQKI
ncbi:hypothetical protein [Streptobacillus moniliformis]|uniref:hypothetical protein n=1 Tax=Streptobacillus moniliformis TaxID=34105 RepID=UPI0007E3B1F7|nr:hypothetical protein [Streptobacillus moniliformis]